MGSLAYFDLPALKKSINAKVFIETGFGWGTGMLTAAKCDFEKLYSIEISPEVIYRGYQQVANDPRIQLVCADSISGLKWLIPNISHTNCIFFLDSHFPNADLGLAGFGDEKNEDLRLPLLNELQLLKDERASKGYKDIILLDDLFLYDDDNKYPGDGWKAKLDILPRKDRNKHEQIVSFFNETHSATRTFDDNGYVSFVPKGV
jgi:hypothetical protein